VGPPDVVISEEYGRMLWQRARNAVEYDFQHEEWLKRQAEEQRIMEQQEKQYCAYNTVTLNPVSYYSRSYG
jgi:uncharacterized membrane protein YcaP (DUF421 family)